MLIYTVYIIYILHYITYIYIPVSHQKLHPKFPGSSAKITPHLLLGAAVGGLYFMAMVIASISWNVIPTIC